MHRFIYKTLLAGLFVLVGCQELSSSQDRDATSIPNAVNTTQVNPSPELSIVYPQNDQNNNAFIQVAENNTSVLRVSAQESPDSKLIYRLQDGPDMHQFVLDANTGALSFKDVPDWEQPQDADQNNNYMVLWQVLSSTGQARSQFLIIQVTDLPD
ncbi:MAG: cadherin repeat domain-containing protein [Cyanobacteria bacterium P01_D01_bin.105]